ncbi:hypothetical protein F5051DRAFT_504592 [Lentinula edodes]|nr:hypothetical protein F5051DRAFT_504592 [Lentinula edodes]
MRYIRVVYGHAQTGERARERILKMGNMRVHCKCGCAKYPLGGMVLVTVKIGFQLTKIVLEQEKLADRVAVDILSNEIRKRGRPEIFVGEQLQFMEQLFNEFLAAPSKIVFFRACHLKFMEEFPEHQRITVDVIRNWFNNTNHALKGPRKLLPNPTRPGGLKYATILASSRPQSSSELLCPNSGARAPPMSIGPPSQPIDTQRKWQNWVLKWREQLGALLQPLLEGISNLCEVECKIEAVGDAFNVHSTSDNPSYPSARPKATVEHTTQTKSHIIKNETCPNCRNSKRKNPPSRPESPSTAGKLPPGVSQIGKAWNRKFRIKDEQEQVEVLIHLLDWKVEPEETTRSDNFSWDDLVGDDLFGEDDLSGDSMRAAEGEVSQLWSMKGWKVKRKA